jgi:raffinose/stachyose/melibiose transport system permease protein
MNAERAENKGEPEMKKALKKYWAVFVLPTLAAFMIGFIVPFVQGLYLSFLQICHHRQATFMGVQKLRLRPEGRGLRPFLLVHRAFAVLSTVLINVIALAIALALTRNMKGANIHRTVFFMPNLIGGIVLGYIWLILLNCALSLMGKPLLALNATYGFWGLIILMCWQQIGYMMIIYIAGLQSIPSGLSGGRPDRRRQPWQTLWKVKIPNLMSSITICLFLSITNGFKLFDQNLALTGGDPGHASEMLALNIYNTFYARSGPQWKGIRPGQGRAVLHTGGTHFHDTAAVHPLPGGAAVMKARKDLARLLSVFFTSVCVDIPHVHDAAGLLEAGDRPSPPPPPSSSPRRTPSRGWKTT